ncbi:short-chain dehydrogenase [Gammaproteobacteria bacterium MFB021]|nr:short-chain dehydrogenase [Gammaproteobacteria bacterium MFB021]
MKILVVGATGTIGKAAADELATDHEVIRVGHTRGDYQVDLTRDDSVEALFAQVGRVDAIVVAFGGVHFGFLNEMSADDFNVGLQNKLLAQVRLVLIGQHYLNDGGSFTLTTGILSEVPIKKGVNAMAVNAGIEGFVKAATTDLGGFRINAVSPTVLTESLGKYGPFFPGFESVDAARVGRAFRRSIEGVQTGQIFKIW